MTEYKGTKALEVWCKRQVKGYPNVSVYNMTTSWKNGMTFCALVHSFRPDLIDFDSLNPENAFENNKLAFTIAEKHLGIPALLDPEDMVKSQAPDRLSILTYLSQFYQKLGHTNSPATSPSEEKVPFSDRDVTSTSPFNRSAPESCTMCGTPVYLAQRLIVSQKLYHRRCVCCTKCKAQLNPKTTQGCFGDYNFLCDTCQNNEIFPKPKNEDQSGMVMFEDTFIEDKEILKECSDPVERVYSKPMKVSDQKRFFEKLNSPRSSGIEKRFSALSVDVVDDGIGKIGVQNTDDLKLLGAKAVSDDIKKDIKSKETELETKMKYPENEMKMTRTQLESIFKDKEMDSKKFDSDRNVFLRAQLDDPDTIEQKNAINIPNIILTKIENDAIVECNSFPESEKILDSQILPSKEDKGNETQLTSPIISPCIEIELIKPPRRKSKERRKLEAVSDIQKPAEQQITAKPLSLKDYPDDLNPFSDDEEDSTCAPPKPVSSNPFGSDEDDEEESTLQDSKVSSNMSTSIAVSEGPESSNPFWSDDDESKYQDEEARLKLDGLSKKSAKSGPKLKRRRKPPAPPPPPCFSSYNSSLLSVNDTSMSSNSTPLSKKKSLAPLAPSSVSVSCETLNSSIDSQGHTKRKGPAPGLPLPERRHIRELLTPEELNTQLQLLETQQQGLEKQGVILERTIRLKCEDDNVESPPQEEIEELVIQLCEIVNEKNDLFRRQAELMYMRRQQRLEQEQADIEHEIRVIQSRPAVNRIDADKAREEYLVARLVAVVKARDALVQAEDMERTRQKNEDETLARSIALARAKRSDDMSKSTMSLPADVKKKSKVKDRVKKQLKKAKVTLNPKKKDKNKDTNQESNGECSKLGLKENV